MMPKGTFLGCDESKFSSVRAYMKLRAADIFLFSKMIPTITVFSVINLATFTPEPKQGSNAVGAKQEIYEAKFPGLRSPGAVSNLELAKLTIENLPGMWALLFVVRC